MRINGTIDLPIGPGRLLFASAHGPLARIIEHWQTSFILNMGTGTPPASLAPDRCGMAIHDTR